MPIRPRTRSIRAQIYTCSPCNPDRSPPPRLHRHDRSTRSHQPIVLRSAKTARSTAAWRSLARCHAAQSLGRSRSAVSATGVHLAVADIRRPTLTEGIEPIAENAVLSRLTIAGMPTLARHVRIVCGGGLHEMVASQHPHRRAASYPRRTCSATPQHRLIPIGPPCRCIWRALLDFEPVTHSLEGCCSIQLS